MSETAFFIEIIKNIGFPAVVFAIWYIYHKSQVKTFEEIIRNNFAVLKDLLETNRQHTAILSRMENKIDANLWCPFIREKTNSEHRRIAGE